MRYTNFFLSAIVLLFSFTVSNAQSVNVESSDRINLGLLGTGVSYSKEIPIASRSTLEGAVGVNSIYHFDDFGIQFRPEISIDYRFYYNITRRERKGKNIAGNSACFIGATTFSQLFPLNKVQGISDKDFLFGGAVFWGVRQQIRDTGFQVNFLGGPAYVTEGLADKNPGLYVRTGISYIF